MSNITKIKFFRKKADWFSILKINRPLKENFRQATIIRLILLAVGILLGVDGYVFYHMRFDSALWTLGAAVFIVIFLYAGHYFRGRSLRSSVFLFSFQYPSSLRGKNGRERKFGKCITGAGSFRVCRFKGTKVECEGCPRNCKAWLYLGILQAAYRDHLYFSVYHRLYDIWKSDA